MEKVEKLQEKAKNIRRDIIEMLGHAKSGHPGGSLDLAEIMAVLYFDVMKYDFNNPQWEDRDYFVLSKGHAAPALYAVLYEGGIISDEELLTLRQVGSRLQGHPDRKKLPGVEASTGSLGQGFAIANGIALAMKLQKKNNYVYAVLGDGELDEGIIWEAAMSAAHYHLDHLIAIVDHNGLQIDGPNDHVMSLGDIGAKFDAFGFEVFHVDGHNIAELQKVFATAKEVKGKPVAIIAKTIKGKGVSFMENQVGWHGTPMSDEDFAKAKAELEE
ncbi:MAG TPA: transketolase [Firmicutes bacterium]|nr:transketolase [Bacillota bacterium]